MSSSSSVELSPPALVIVAALRLLEATPDLPAAIASATIACGRPATDFPADSLAAAFLYFYAGGADLFPADELLEHTSDAVQAHVASVLDALPLLPQLVKDAEEQPDVMEMDQTERTQVVKAAMRHWSRDDARICLDALAAVRSGALRSVVHTGATAFLGADSAGDYTLHSKYLQFIYHDSRSVAELRSAGNLLANLHGALANGHHTPATVTEVVDWARKPRFPPVDFLSADQLANLVKVYKDMLMKTGLRVHVMNFNAVADGQHDALMRYKTNAQRMHIVDLLWRSMESQARLNARATLVQHDPASTDQHLKSRQTLAARASIRGETFSTTEVAGILDYTAPSIAPPSGTSSSAKIFKAEARETKEPKQPKPAAGAPAAPSPASPATGHRPHVPFRNQEVHAVKARAADIAAGAAALPASLREAQVAAADVLAALPPEVNGELLRRQMNHRGDTPYDRRARTVARAALAVLYEYKFDGNIAQPVGVYLCSDLQFLQGGAPCASEDPIVDSAATTCMGGPKAPVQGYTGDVAYVSGIGSEETPCPQGHFDMLIGGKKVRLPAVRNDSYQGGPILSVYELTNVGFSVTFAERSPDGANRFALRRGRHVVAQGAAGPDRLYHLPAQGLGQDKTEAVRITVSKTLHEALGHVSDRRALAAVQGGHVDAGPEHAHHGPEVDCTVCDRQYTLAAAPTAHPQDIERRPPWPGHTIYTDLFSPGDAAEDEAGNFLSDAIIAVDGKTTYLWGAATPNATADRVGDFLRGVALAVNGRPAEHGRLAFVRCDNARNIITNQQLAVEHGFKFMPNPAGVSRASGLEAYVKMVKHGVQRLMATGRDESGVPDDHWPHAFRHFIILHNNTPRGASNTTPAMEMVGALTTTIPAIPFGAFVHYTVTKASDDPASVAHQRAQDGVFLGLADEGGVAFLVAGEDGNTYTTTRPRLMNDEERKRRRAQGNFPFSSASVDGVMATPVYFPVPKPSLTHKALFRERRAATRKRRDTATKKDGVPASDGATGAAGAAGEDNDYDDDATDGESCEDGEPRAADAVGSVAASSAPPTRVDAGAAPGASPGPAAPAEREAAAAAPPQPARIAENIVDPGAAAGAGPKSSLMPPLGARRAGAVERALLMRAAHDAVRADVLEDIAPGLSRGLQLMDPAAAARLLDITGGAQQPFLPSEQVYLLGSHPAPRPPGPHSPPLSPPTLAGVALEDVLHDLAPPLADSGDLAAVDVLPSLPYDLVLPPATIPASIPPHQRILSLRHRTPPLTGAAGGDSPPHAPTRQRAIPLLALTPPLTDTSATRFPFAPTTTDTATTTTNTTTTANTPASSPHSPSHPLHTAPTLALGSPPTPAPPVPTPSDATVAAKQQKQLGHKAAVERWGRVAVERARDIEIGNLRRFTGNLARVPAHAVIFDAIVRTHFIYRDKNEGATDAQGRPLPIALKARLVADGNLQATGPEEHNSSGTSTPTSVRLFLHLSALRDLFTYVVDIKGAYIEAKREKPLFTRPPTGFPDEADSDTKRFLRIERALYGLRDSGLLWHRLITGLLKDQCGLTAVAGDPCFLYRRDPDGRLLLISLYVDDLMIAASDQALLDETIKIIRSRFEISREGPLDHALGLDIKFDRNEGTVSISQASKIREAAAEAGLSLTATDYHPQTAPFGTRSVAQDGSDPGSRKTDPAHAVPRADITASYQSLLGKLQHIANWSRNDVAAALGILASHAAKPTENHWQMLRGVVRYLLPTQDKALVLGRGRKHPHAAAGAQDGVVIHADASWDSEAGSTSRTGFAVYHNGACIAWRSSLQRRIALSSHEAEVASVLTAAKDAVWLQDLIQEILGGAALRMPTDIYTDNLPTVAVLNNPSNLRHRTKHIARDVAFLRQLVEEGRISVRYVPGAFNLADVLTKALYGQAHVDAVEHLGAFKGSLPPRVSDPTWASGRRQQRSATSAPAPAPNADETPDDQLPASQ